MTDFFFICNLDIGNFNNLTGRSDRRETRRHESLSEWDDKDGRAADSSDVMTDVFRALEAEALHRAIATLKPDEQELLHRLYLDKSPMTQAEYARQLGTTIDKVKDKDVLEYQRLPLRDRVLRALFGRGQRVLVLIPGDSVRAVTIKEVEEGQTE